MYDPVRDALMSNTTTATTTTTAAAAAAAATAATAATAAIAGGGEEGRQRMIGEPMVLCENVERVIVERTGYGGGGASFVFGARGPAPTTDDG